VARFTSQPLCSGRITRNVRTPRPDSAWPVVRGECGGGHRSSLSGGPARGPGEDFLTVGQGEVASLHLQVENLPHGADRLRGKIMASALARYCSAEISIIPHITDS
jgi:hypothetical protein